MSWWVVRAERTVSEDVPAPPGDVRAFYVDLNNLKIVHPLIVAVQVLSRTQTVDGYLYTYQVRDRIPLKFLAFRVAYRARLHVPMVGDVHTEADQFPGIRLRGTVSFESAGNGTRLTERILIAAPRPLAGFTVRSAVNAHHQMLVGIRRHFDSR
ncbi:SRPBCC family protein [Mycobacterium sp. 1423905.2]|uniref:SRPBCC family protein n=1 Tax=Mycobacterium sp. 1423905.2 TaxID=1856859 RepID=UPI0007FFD70C|nr:SRPBCC family protein [Mycobacterium sp. 1423905.2]OBJ52782.1 polyketide cyclase / dehydrase and lipid transport [Mycobacterium sp. 1423905.2]